MIDFTFPDIFTELIGLLTISVLIGILSIRLRQPLIIAFIAVGILVGPAGLNIVKATDQIHVLAEMGLALLLFVVGLKLDLQLIRNMGSVALATGIGQVVFTTIGGFLISLALGMTPLTALYVAIALTFSSTIIIVKLLSDKREIDSLHGRIALGFLIVQDIVVVLAMIGLSAFTGETTLHPALQFGLILVKGVALFAAVWFASFFVLPRVLPIVSRSTELLVLFGITWALLLAVIGDLLGFSKEVGAFAAGVSLASTAYRDILGAKLVSLRDFLLLFFFLELGSRLELQSLGSQVAGAIPLSLFVLIGNPIIVMVIMGAMGYRKRTSFMAGLTVAQISEFSLILIAMGFAAGHVDSQAVGLVTLVGLTTIALSTYMIIYAQPLYDRLAPYLRIFERTVQHREDANMSLLALDRDARVILIGLGSYGSNIGGHLRRRGRQVVGVDFDPQAVAAWNARGEVAIFGDAEDPDFAEALPLSSSRWVVSSIRDPQINAAIVSSLRHSGYSGNIAFAAHTREGLPAVLREEGDLVFVPFEDAAEQAVELLLTKEEEIEQRNMEKTIHAMANHYIVCGYGRMGQQIVKDFARQQAPVIVVENNPEQLQKLRDARVPHVIGSASEDRVLMTAGIKRAQALIAVAATDEENVFIALTARVLNANLLIIARSIREENEDKLYRAGANRVVSPYILGGRRMAAAVTRPRFLEFLDLLLHDDQGEIDIGNIPIATHSPFVDQTVEAVGFGQSITAVLLAVRRPPNQLHANPCADFRLHAGDELIVMGTPEQIAQLETRAVQADTKNANSGAQPGKVD